MERRALVLTTESAGHAFRRRLPPHVFAPLAMPATRQDDSDWKLFLLSFVTFFTLFYSFIA